MTKRIGVLGLAMACLLTCVAFQAAEAEIKTLTLTREDLDNAGASRLHLLFNIGGARVNLVQADTEAFIVRAVVEFSDPQLEPTLGMSSRDDVFIANFQSGFIRGFPPSEFVHIWEITVGTYDIDTRLTIDLGGVDADTIDLGNMPLSDLTLNVGGSLVTIDFSSPTSRSTDRVVVNCGGADLSMMNLGNTDFDSFVLNAGGAAINLHFHGSYAAGEHQVFASLAGSGLGITVPTDAGESAEIFSLVSTIRVSGEGWETEVNRPFRKKFVTDDFDDQSVKLALEIIAVASAVDLDRGFE